MKQFCTGLHGRTVISEEGMGMEQYWHWFCSIPGLYRTQREMLLRCFGSPRGVWHASKAELDRMSEKGCSWAEHVRQFQNCMTPEGILHRDWMAGIQFISHEHTMYPRRLKQIKDYPYGLFYRGKLPREEQRAVAVVGARMCTPAGKDRAAQLAHQIVLAGGNVISGAAYGIDGAAQWSALENGGESYAVVGGGLDRYYPKSHAALFERLEKSGGIISEYAWGTPAVPRHFPMRNRIISGLADVVVVIEARKKSGSLITAEYAADQGRRVVAVPGRPEDELSQGCNELINQGAEVFLSTDSFIDTVFPEYKVKKRNLSDDLPLAPAEKLVYISLGLHSKSLWELAECTALSLEELSRALMQLEMKGLIKENEYNRYLRTI